MTGPTSQLRSTYQSEQVYPCTPVRCYPSALPAGLCDRPALPKLPRVQLAYDFADGSGDQETASRLDELACQVTVLGEGKCDCQLVKV